MKKQFFSSQVGQKLGSIQKLPHWLRDFPEDFRDQIKLIRETLGMTQTQLGKRAGCSLRYIQGIENGRAAPIATIKKIADILNADLKLFVLPRQDLSKYLEEKATQKARQIVGLSKASSSLEIQTPSNETRDEQIESLKKEILEKRRSSLWES
jgi:transcriptional regulator with XRE-family HTH domain